MNLQRVLNTNVPVCICCKSRCNITKGPFCTVGDYCKRNCNNPGWICTISGCVNDCYTTWSCNRATPGLLLVSSQCRGCYTRKTTHKITSRVLDNSRYDDDLMSQLQKINNLVTACYIVINELSNRDHNKCGYCESLTPSAITLPTDVKQFTWENIKQIIFLEAMLTRNLVDLHKHRILIINM